MRIGAIDQVATNGASWLHRTSPVSKLVAFALVLAAVVTTWNVLVVLAVVLLLAAAIVSARVPARLAFGLAAYPALFAALFALASAGSWMIGAVIVLKAACAGLAAVTITLTTPYPQIFAPIQRITPTLVGDSLLMTYRSTFLLLDKFSSLLRAVRLRSGLSRGEPVRAARATTQALGGLLLYSLDLAQRDYDIMRLRGYEGRLRTTLPRSERPGRDVALIALALSSLAASVVWRLGAAALNPYSWIVPLVPAALLCISIVTSRRKA